MQSLLARDLGSIERNQEWKGALLQGWSVWRRKQGMEPGKLT